MRDAMALGTHWPRRASRIFSSITGSSTRAYRTALDLPDLRRALQFGCNYVGEAFTLASRGAQVVGIDGIPSTVIAASSKSQENTGGERTTFVEMSLESLGFEDSSFQLVYGAVALSRARLSEALREVARVLEPGGTAVFLEPLGTNPLINLYRRATAATRQRYEHPLLVSDIELLSRYFGSVEQRFFHFTTLAAAFFQPLPAYRTILRAAEYLDERIFVQVPALRRFAWMSLFVLRVPLDGATTRRRSL